MCEEPVERRPELGCEIQRAFGPHVGGVHIEAFRGRSGFDDEEFRDGVRCATAFVADLGQADVGETVGLDESALLQRQPHAAGRVPDHSRSLRQCRHLRNRLDPAFGLIEVVVDERAQRHDRCDRGDRVRPGRTMIDGGIKRVDLGSCCGCVATTEMDEHPAEGQPTSEIVPRTEQRGRPVVPMRRVIEAADQAERRRKRDDPGGVPADEVLRKPVQPDRQLSCRARSVQIPDRPEHQVERLLLFAGSQKVADRGRVVAGVPFCRGRPPMKRSKGRSILAEFQLEAHE